MPNQGVGKRNMRGKIEQQEKVVLRKTDYVAHNMIMEDRGALFVDSTIF